MCIYPYTVSVCMLAYNQETSIAQAIEGVLMQKTNFSVHLYIGEDFSTDNTRQICLHYKSKYPDKITLLLASFNLGMRNNFSNTLYSCMGKYIAMCEGDDYWIDPYKLQKQVDFMENNIGYSLVYHKVTIYNEKDNQYFPEFFNTLKEKKSYSIADLAKGNFIHTPSVLFRKESLDMPFLLKIGMILDYTCWMLCADKGLIKYLPDAMAVYRVSDGSIWELKADQFKKVQMIEVLIPLLKRFSNNKNIYSILFHQLKTIYERLYLNAKENDSILDHITKKILVELKSFQVWWFRFVIRQKAKRGYILKYFLYLIRKFSLSSSVLVYPLQKVFSTSKC